MNFTTCKRALIILREKFYCKTKDLNIHKSDEPFFLSFCYSYAINKIKSNEDGG